MSAPSTVYTGDLLPANIVGVARYDSYFALMLSAYGSSVKSLFYIDALLRNPRGDGFLGACIIGGANYNMHNPSRYSKIKFKIGADVYHVLNDAGLNTRAGAGDITPISYSFVNIQVSGDFFSAYYVPTTNYGIRARVEAYGGVWSAWDVVGYGTMAEQVVKNDFVMNVPPNAEGRRRWQVELFITNPEGDTPVPGLLDFYTTLQPITLWPGSYGGAGTTYYIDSATIVTVENGGNTRLYTNDDATGELNANQSYWIDNRYYYEYAYSPLNDNFTFIRLVDSVSPTPPTPPVQDYTGYSATSESDAVAQVLGGALVYTGSLYYNEVDGKIYHNWNNISGFSVIPDDGWYAGGDVSQITFVYEIIGGVKQ